MRASCKAQHINSAHHRGGHPTSHYCSDTHRLLFHRSCQACPLPIPRSSISTHLSKTIDCASLWTYQATCHLRFWSLKSKITPAIRSSRNLNTLRQLVRVGRIYLQLEHLFECLCVCYSCFLVHFASAFVHVGVCFRDCMSSVCRRNLLPPFDPLGLTNQLWNIWGSIRCPFLFIYAYSNPHLTRSVAVRSSLKRTFCSCSEKISLRCSMMIII